MNLEKYDVNLLELSSDRNLRIVQEKVLNNEDLNMREKLMLGRDHPVKEIDGYKLKSDCAYRAVSKDLLEKYIELGFVYGVDSNDEYIEYEKNGTVYNNNRGVDWYLGGASFRYGNVVIECPAYKEYFTLAYDNGCHLSYDPMVRHIKSSGYKNPVPVSLIKVIKYPDNNLENNTIKR